MSKVTYKRKELCRVRTITAFLVLEQDSSTWKNAILEATEFCNDLACVFRENEYQVQSIRIVTNPFGEYLDTRSVATAASGLERIRGILDASNTSGLRIRFAIGEAVTPEEIALLPGLIQEYGDLCNACVNVGKDEWGVLDNGLIHCAAEAVSQISCLTPQGQGNFNFTVNFNCPSFIPYFPAGYHRQEQGNCFVVGLETPDLLVAALQEFRQSNSVENHNARFRGYQKIMGQALQYHVSIVTAIIKGFDRQTDFSFAGIDSSAAPSKNCASMVDVYTLLGVEYFGAAGTVAASSLLTSVFKSIKGVDLKGFSGLMLAVTEDQGLAEGTKKADFDIRALLTYSSVCGIGLDTVPIPGNTPIDKITALMRDTGTLAHRLDKPLTVRLFPIPGLSAGDITCFDSDDLCDCAVLCVP